MIFFFFKIYITFYGFFPLPFSDWYDDYALMLSDDANVISGLLVGLKVLDFNLFFKGDELDNQVSNKILKYY